MRANQLLPLSAGMLGLVCATHAEQADRPDVHVGDRWSFQHTNALANEKDFTTIQDVIDVSNTEIKARERIKGKGVSSVAAYTREWNPVDVASARYEPNLHEWSFPLKVGSQWDSSADKMLFTNGKHGKFQLKALVAAAEKVTVPAGAFDTYWYAPAVKHYVKSEIAFSRDGRVRSKDTYELVEYSLR